MRRTFLAIAVASAAVFAVAQMSEAGTIAPMLVKGRSAIDEFLPSSDGTYLLWSQNTIARPRHYDAFIEPLDHGVPPLRVNAGGTDGFPGPTINGTEAMFQEVRKGARYFHSNIYLYNTTTDTRSNPPGGINTRAWEWNPSSSPGYILFERNWSVMLYNRTSPGFLLLDKARSRCRCIFAGSVTDSYATWNKCVPKCQSYYYDITGDAMHKVPNPSAKQQYSPAVSGDSGSIYFARSGNGCGLNVKLMRYDIGGGNPVVVSSLRDGKDMFYSPSVYTDGQSSDHVYFGRVDCRGSYYADIYKVDGAEAPTLTESASRSRGRGGLARPPDPRANPSGR